MPGKNATVSIVIPAYNSAAYIAETLHSVKSQRYQNWECLIIDNGSSDDTKTIVHSFIDHDARFHYHYCEQNGVSFARNLGVKLSQGSLILPLDSDDKIADTYLEKAVRVLQSDSSIKLVYCDAELFGAAKGKWILPSFSYKELLIENSIFCSALFRKKDFESAGGYNENMREGFEDWDFWIRFLKPDDHVYKIPEVLFYYRIRPSSRNNILDTDKQLALRRRLYINNKERYDGEFDLPQALFEVYRTKQQLSFLEKSPEYKLGAFLLKPFRYIKKILAS